MLPQPSSSAPQRRERRTPSRPAPLSNRILRQRSISSASEGPLTEARGSMASFDLNEMPAVDEDVPAGVEEMVNETGEKRRSDTATGEEYIGSLSGMVNHKANEKLGQGGNAITGEADNGSSPGQWQACTPAQLPRSLYTQHHPVHYVISRRADATSEYAWRSWLPPKHASPGGAVIQPSEWVTLPSIFTPRLARPALATPAPGRGTMPDVTSAFSDPARAWSTGSLQQVEASLTTTDGAANRDASHKSDSYRPQSGKDHRMENSGMEDLSSEDSCITEGGELMTVGKVLPQEQNGSALQEKSTLVEDGSRAPLVEVDSPAEDGREHGVPMPVGDIPSHEKDGSAPQAHLDPGHGEGEAAPKSDDIRGAELLQHLFKQERKKKREADFLASFTFGTELCNPTAPCKSCLKFFKAPVPRSLLKSRLTFQGVFSHHKHPPVLENMDAEEMAKRKESRHGPKSMSSEFRGVTYYKRTQRWESHVWHRGKQVYLGASATKEEAAKSYDQATLMMHGLHVDINYELTSYQKELDHLYKLNKKQLVLYLRRDSRGLGAQAAYPSVKRVKNRFQAMYRGVLWGAFSTMEEAARKVYEAALKNGSGKLAAKIINTHHVRNMPSFAGQYFVAVYPEEVEALCRQPKKRGRSRATKQPALTSPPPVEKQLPARCKNLNGSVRVAAKRTRRT